MLQLIYVSAATRPLWQEELVALLAESRAANLARGISGMLLYHRGSFLQVLEGPSSVVDELAARIRSDPRHQNMNVLFRREISVGNFVGWSMGFMQTTDGDITDVPGYLDYLAALAPAAVVGDPNMVWREMDRFRLGELRQFSR